MCHADAISDGSIDVVAYAIQTIERHVVDRVTRSRTLNRMYGFAYSLLHLSKRDARPVRNARYDLAHCIRLVMLHNRRCKPTASIETTRPRGHISAVYGQLWAKWTHETRECLQDKKRAFCSCVCACVQLLVPTNV